MITQEEKRKIAARCFYADNMDEYEDFQEAMVDFMGQHKPSDTFVNFVVDEYLKPEAGLSVWMSIDGHVATIREKDGYFKPRTMMFEDDALKMQADYEQASIAFPNLKQIELLPKIGWKRIAQDDLVHLTAKIQRKAHNGFGYHKKIEGRRPDHCGRQARL